MRDLSIWVVDDDHLYQNMLVSYLAVLGYHSKGFDSGEECVYRLNENPDIILLDHNLGTGMKGMDVLRRIKSESKSTRVIYISGEEKVSLVSEAYQNGSEEFISKDSASLIRLKLRLEKIKRFKDFSRRRLAKRILAIVGGLLVFGILLVVFNEISG